MKLSSKRKSNKGQGGANTCRSARVHTSCGSPDRLVVQRLRMSEAITPLHGGGSLTSRVPMKTTQEAYERRDSDSGSADESSVQVLPYLTKQPTGTLST